MSALDRGETIWIADAHRGDGKRSIVRAPSISSARLSNFERQVLTVLSCIHRYVIVLPWLISV